MRPFFHDVWLSSGSRRILFKLVLPRDSTLSCTQSVQCPGVRNETKPKLPVVETSAEASVEANAEFRKCHHPQKPR